MSNPKKQHYVPQTYLRQFTGDNGTLSIYDMVKKEFRKQKPSAVGYSTHFYTVEIEGEKDYFIEKYLAEHVDVLYPDLLLKISNKQIFNAADRKKLGIFLAAQYLRTPAQRKNYNRMIQQETKQINRLVHSARENLGQLTDAMKNQKIAKVIKEGTYEVNVPKERSLYFLLSFIEEMATMLTKQNIIILEACKKSEFITSDNPYTMVKDKWARGLPGFGIINTTKVIPFSPKYLLLLKDVGDKVLYPQIVSSKEVRVYNQHITNWADRYLFAKNEYILKSMVHKSASLK